MKGALHTAKNGGEKAVLAFLKKALERKLFDAVLIPAKVPAGDSYAYLLIKDPALLDRATVLPPVMAVQGARALTRLTRLGAGEGKIAAVMRPCEVRAVIELSKLEQVDLEKVFLISQDCPGALPLDTYVEDPKEGETQFSKSRNSWNGEEMRPVCQICDHCSLTSAELHIGYMGANKSQLYFIPNSREAKSLLNELEMDATENLQKWESASEEIIAEKKENKKKVLEDLRAKVQGAENLMKSLAFCINCHNCQRVCPICYCRQCYFDSEALKLSPRNYIARANRKGSLRFPPDTLLFHLGRMSHMALSCVSCGACEDACPMDVPVAQLFTLAAEDAQKEFEYAPGADRNETLPLIAYRKDEFKHVENAYVKKYSLQEEKNG